MQTGVLFLGTSYLITRQNFVPSFRLYSTRSLLRDEEFKIDFYALTHVMASKNQKNDILRVT